MITCNNLTKSFGDLLLFERLNFSIDDGDFVCFSGKSGAGKTTLLNIIGLIEPFDAGKLIIDGIEYKSNKQKIDFYRTKVGFLFQNFALIDNKTVRQNLDLIHKNNRNDYTIDEVLELVGLSDKVDNKVYTLSGGEQQRIALARLFLKKCDIILADEPTGSLDADNANIIMQILIKLNNAGKTVIMVTHDDTVKRNANKVIEL